MIPENPQEEGWVLSSGENGLFQIQRFDEPQDGSQPKFANDDEAYTFVLTEMMRLRKKLHQYETALKAHQQNSFVVTPLPEFPNGFTNWYETFYQLATMIQNNMDHADPYTDSANVIRDTHDLEGSFGLITLAKEWTDEFENLNRGVNWGEDDDTGRHREYFDEVEEFFHLKVYPTQQHEPQYNDLGQQIPNLWPPDLAIHYHAVPEDTIGVVNGAMVTNEENYLRERSRQEALRQSMELHRQMANQIAEANYRRERLEHIQQRYERQFTDDIAQQYIGVDLGNQTNETPQE